MIISIKENHICDTPRKFYAVSTKNLTSECRASLECPRVPERGGGKCHGPKTHHTFEKPRQQACKIRHKLVPRRRGGQLRYDVTSMLHQGRIEFSLVLFLSFNVVFVIVVLTTSLEIHICTLGDTCIHRCTSCIITSTYLGHENIFNSGANALKVSISL